MSGRPSVASALTVFAFLFTAGCIATPTALEPTATVPNAVPALVNLLADRGGFEVEVPVRVLLVGFAPGTAEALQAELPPARIDHDYLNAANTITDPEEAITGGFGLFTNPALPIARYEVTAAAPELTQHLLDAIATTMEVEAEGYTLYDGRAFEELLAETLQPSADTPVFVILHGGDVLAEEHGWRYTYETGWIDRVRIFGGKQPVLVFDASAQTDPYVVRGGFNPFAPIGQLLFGTPAEPPAYNFPLDASGDATVEALAQAATDAAHYRLVQGPIYPNSVRPCHTVLVYVGVRATSVAHLVGAADPASLVDTATLTSGFTNLTSAPTTVEARVVQLPVEDPALDAATRNDLNYDLFRAWADMNWDTFFEDDGCEHYLNTLVVTDAAEGVHGIALMDVERNRRISFSWVDDETRLREDDGSPLSGTPLFSRPESRIASNWATFLIAHEGGHLFGQTHPHNAIYDEPVEGEREASPATFAFSATWDAMSYQVTDRVSDFGALAATNFQRNRAGFVLGEAMEQGLEGTPEFQQALEMLGQYRWKDAADTLVPLLEQNARSA